ncbi:MAG: rhodanese-like domain-containing protein [Endozoicomonadaceae bacterium]|nr:rhodanese-like domain-containing protein [Endozoicomonadaceae bacterium]MBE8233253.1 rhodanese-like domain-containing protein [Endozoicomonadaceae bacterium]
MDQLLLFIMNHPFLIGAFVILLILLVWTEKRKSGRAITNQELVQLLNKNNALIVDLRDEKIFSEGHITHAINLPYTKLNERMAQLEKHKSKTIILVCNYGHHSGSSIPILAKQGFDSLVRLQGGIQGWITERLPLIKG